MNRMNRGYFTSITVRKSYLEPASLPPPLGDGPPKPKMNKHLGQHGLHVTEGPPPSGVDEAMADCLVPPEDGRFGGAPAGVLPGGNVGRGRRPLGVQLAPCIPLPTAGRTPGAPPGSTAEQARPDGTHIAGWPLTSCVDTPRVL